MEEDKGVPLPLHPYTGGPHGPPPAESRDATTWGLTYLDVIERGMQFQDLACDGGTGLRAGVREAELAIPCVAPQQA